LICLLTIAKNKSMTATTISREVFLSPSTIVGILDRLEVKGLIKRERSQVDRRVVTVEVTELGRKIVKRSPSPLQERLQRRLSELPSTEQEEIASSLERVVSFMEASDVDAAPILEIGSIASKPADKDGVNQ
jgi:DNA-binding MarR family transcriptional regulator